MAPVERRRLGALDEGYEREGENERERGAVFCVAAHVMDARGGGGAAYYYVVS